MTAAQPGSPTSLRAANQRRVVRAVRSASELSQAEIARRTGLSPATVSNVVRDLAERGLLTVSTRSRGGRRVRSVRLARSAGVAVGVDFGHRHLRVAIADLGHVVLAEERISLPRDFPAADGLDTATALVDRLLTNAGAHRSEVVGFGLGLPAPIDLRTGMVGSSSILPGWVGVIPAEALAERVGASVLVDNDANLGALAEATWGAGQDIANLAYIKLSAGVGAGLVLEGRIFRGTAGTAGEIGHTSIDEHGPVCRCGNRGCLETFASVPVVLKLLEPSHGPDLTITDVVSRAGQGDPGCRRVIADTGRHIGLAVANLCNLLNPERIVIGGELGQAGPLLLDPLRDVVRRFAIPSAAQTAEIVASTLGARAPVLGAIALVLREGDQLIAAAGGKEARMVPPRLNSDNDPYGFAFNS